MRYAIVLCGGGDDADAAANWAEDRAREARLSTRAAKLYGERVRMAYEEACHAFLSASTERPVLKISLEKDVLTPRFDLIDTAPSGLRKSPRAIRALRAREILRTRAARQCEV